MPELTRLAKRTRAFVQRLGLDRSGVAMIEFAYTAPFFVLLLGGGVELANFAITHMRISQAAVSLADNASRAKQGVVSGMPRMREVDVNEAFHAANLQGSDLQLTNRARLILSSVEVNRDGGQWIRWQRCFGQGGFNSSYGQQGDGATGTSIAGVGPVGRGISAESGVAVMFVEVAYDYRPLIMESIVGRTTIRKTAAMMVRDQRDLSVGIVNPSPAVAVSRCV
ncbi:MAG: pilus assembly protein [Sphingomonadales bacterium]|nr:pilus assembly protein [Sphingomonadaceae bacterium]MBS3931535.1 pilus assembly protein [Sphingomonadales bacterium]